jgi:hypothetical protein
VDSISAAMKRSVDIDHPLVFEWMVTRRLQILFSTAISPREALPAFFHAIAPPVPNFSCLQTSTGALRSDSGTSVVSDQFKDIEFQIFSKCENFPKVGTNSKFTISPEDAFWKLFEYKNCTLKLFPKSKSPDSMFKTAFTSTRGGRQLLLMTAVNCCELSEISIGEILGELSKANPLCDKEESYNVLLICSSKYQAGVNAKFGSSNILKIISEFENLHEVYALKLESVGFANFFGDDAYVLETIQAVIAMSNKIKPGF